MNSYLFENLDDSFEKKVEGRVAGLIADVSWEEVGTNGCRERALFLVIPEWKVDLSGTFREKELTAPLPAGDKGSLLKKTITIGFKLCTRLKEGIGVSVKDL